MRRLILSMLVGLAAAHAQQLGTAGFHGVVLDAQGASIAGARVTLTHVERNQDRTATANVEGSYGLTQQ